MITSQLDAYVYFKRVEISKKVTVSLKSGIVPFRKIRTSDEDLKRFREMGVHEHMCAN